MKLPEKVFGRHKLRDVQIIDLYSYGDKTSKELGEMFEVTQRRISQILRRNSSLLKNDKNVCKAKRINHLHKLLRDHPNELGKKGTLDILSQLHDEEEGIKSDKTDVSVTVVMNNVAVEGKPLEYRLGDIIPS